MPILDLAKARVFNIKEVVDYDPGSVVSKTLLKKNTGYVTVSASFSGIVQAEKISPFDILVHVVEGKTEVIINKTSFVLNPAQLIIIPAHSSYATKALEKSLIVYTIIKGGYEALI